MRISGCVENHYLKEGPAPFAALSSLTGDSLVKDERTNDALHLPITVFVADLSQLRFAALPDL